MSLILPSGFITVRGARQNNLKNLDLDIPLNELVVLTGVSGSGKSSLAFDTLYAEGQRRYTETFSPYTRQFLERMDKPQVDKIEGIPPSIAIQQANSVRTSRSTVGTMTEIADYLKLLYPSIATLHSPLTGRQIKPWKAQDLADTLLLTHPGKTILITFNVPFPSSTPWKDLCSFLSAQGFVRVLHGDKPIRLEPENAPDLRLWLSSLSSSASPPESGSKTKSPKKNLAAQIFNIPVVTDRITLDQDSKARLMEALESSFRFGKGLLSIHVPNAQPLAFSQRWFCPESQQEFTPPSPALFSFNNPIGACPVCRGFGRTVEIDYGLALPDRKLSIEEGVVKPFQTDSNAECQKDLTKACKRKKISLTKPFQQLSPEQQHFVLSGDDRKGKTNEQIHDQGLWYGVKGFFEWMETRSYKMHVRVLLSRYRAYHICPACLGTRFQPQTHLWKIQGKSLPELNDLAFKDLLPFLEKIHTPDESSTILLQQIRSRVQFLSQVGLGYLTLNRTTRTLSGGEVQRVNLTTCLGTSLVGTMFVLDEPSIGLHPRDTDQLIKVLQCLRDQGNSILVVEHDASMMRAADRVIELGPGRGQGGGHLSFQGSVAQMLEDPKSLTGGYLSHRLSIPLPLARRPLKNAINLLFKGAAKHNVRKMDFQIPLRRLTAITGVSGSGKSTLVEEIIYKHLTQSLGRTVSEAGSLTSLKNTDLVSDVVLVDQSPLTQTPRSTPLLYLGVYDAVRDLFAATDDARQTGVGASCFSFNTGTGRCTRCNGTGYELIKMQFLSDVYVRCPVCEGKRFQKHVLQVKYHGISIDQLLEMTIQEGIDFFSLEITAAAAKEVKQREQIRDGLALIQEVGLGYLKCGQPLNQLSGGESQRLKLVSYLFETLKKKSGKKRAPQVEPNADRIENLTTKVLILDEPTTGLHFDDIRVLVQVLQRLVDAGHTLIVIEHNLDVIKCADYILDLGPESGDGGGDLVASGTPEEISLHPKSLTGFYLKDFLAPAKISEKKCTQKTAILPKKAPSRFIEISGARHHNLKNVSLKIPRDQMVVITGLSGSGKSTLAFDLLFAEGQRRYLDCLNNYARQFMEQMEKPRVDAILGIPPSVAIEQRTTRGGGKSTVATITELYHFMRLLYAKMGQQHDPQTGEACIQQSPEDIIKNVQLQLRNHELSLMAPLVRGRKGLYTEIAAWAEKKGFPFLRVDGHWIAPDKFKALDRYRDHNIDLILGNINKKTDNLAALINQALSLGKGTLYTLNNYKKETVYSTALYSPSTGRSFNELDPRLFSFNSPHGWCPVCEGYGSILKISTDENLSEIEQEQQREWLRESADTGEAKICPACHGSKLNEIARAVRFGGKPITEINAMTISDFRHFFSSLKWKGREAIIMRDIQPEIEQRLRFLQHVGLDYLNLDRAAPTLSGGESQRIRLAAQLGSNLQGVLYVLDEPTIGLHPRDNTELIKTLRQLQQRGNSVVIVEHDEEMMKEADHIIDLGPGAGIHGGEIVAQGSWKKIAGNKKSATGLLLGKPLKHPMRGKRRPCDKSIPYLKIQGAQANNLKNISISIPLGRLTVLSGVSGSGKSTLLRQIIQPAVLNAIKKTPLSKSLRRWSKVQGAEHITHVTEVDQSPIGKTSRSTVITYLGLMDRLRELFASTNLAKARGFTANYFSYNSGPGRCQACQGQGTIKIDMNFLPSTYTVCEKCQGRRWSDPVLETLFKDKNIHDVLQLSVDEAVTFFENQSAIQLPLKLMQQTGLGYLTLGQTSPTLSGGEAQRLKLVTELAASQQSLNRMKMRSLQKIKAHTLYLLEEPTVGLHLADVKKLIELLHQLVEEGHTVIVIEHHLNVIAEADHVIDIGPEAGLGGGTIVGEGTPEDIAKCVKSHTGNYLKKVLC